MKPQGILELPIALGRTLLHFGQKDGTDFAQISFPGVGAMNGEVEKAVITENAVDITLDINAMAAPLLVERADGAWSGHWSLKSIDFAEDFQGTLLTTEPDFQEEHYIIPEQNVEILRSLSTYDDEPCEGLLTYELGNPQVLSYLQENGYPASVEPPFAAAKALMARLCELISQDGVNYCHDRKNRGTIAQMAFAAKQDLKTNCRGIAIILAGILRAYGFRASYVECWPGPQADQDIHVVCEFWCPDLRKQVLMDPSSNLIYFLDGTPLSLLELRQALCDGRGGDITINADAHHGQEPVDAVSRLAFMSKELAVLSKSIHACEEKEMDGDNTITLLSRDSGDTRFDEGIVTSNVRLFYAEK